MIGGGTYARAMDNCVAFGCCSPGQEGTAHKKDEYLTLNNISLNPKIICKVVYELAK